MTDCFIPSSEVLDAWTGGRPVNDVDLQKLQTFFQHMVAGLDALGARYALIAEALGREAARASHIQIARCTR